MTTIRKTILITAALLTALAARADEGMWLPSLISERIADMQSKGCRLSAEDIYSINQASLKDAVVLFGRGCTGEMISPDGLLLTNHHCGFPQIQKHSSVDHDYLRDGFWAMNRSEELPNEGLSVSFLVRMDDVTSRILNGCTPDLDETRRKEIVKDVKKLGEEAKVAIRNIRRDMTDGLKKIEKEENLPEDTVKDNQDKIQKLTDKYVGIIDAQVVEKEKEVMTV